ncbi:MAG: hypothetical protein ACXW2P_02700 [Thermoanaerobaculia bacterium]
MHQRGPEPSPRLGATPLFLAAAEARANSPAAYTVDDAIRWGSGPGLLDAPLREARALLAAEAASDHVDEQSLQAASERFRYDHDLISAGETEEWLVSRGMTIDDFGGWLRARLSVETQSGAGSAEMEDVPGDFLRVHLWLSGEMEKLAQAYSRSVAAEIETGRGDAAAVETLTKKAISDAARQRKLAAIGMSLIRVEVQTLVVDSEAAGREAVMCVRTDHAPLAQVAADAGYPSDRIETWIDDFEPIPRRHLLGASVGDAIGPLAEGEKFTVYQLLRRDEPSLARDEVVRRIDEILVDEFFDDLCSRHIRLPDTMRTRT